MSENSTPSSSPSPLTSVQSPLTQTPTQTPTQTQMEAPIQSALPSPPHEKSILDMTDAELSAAHARLRSLAFQPQTLAAHLAQGLEDQDIDVTKKKRTSKSGKSEYSAEQKQALMDEFS
jgi:hypothetical protein